MIRAMSYDQDVIIWAKQQSKWLRTKCIDLLDIERIADEIEDVGKRLKREFSHRMVLLLAELLKWVLQPNQRIPAKQIIIRNHRRALTRFLQMTPSLKCEFDDPNWWDSVWDETIICVAENTGCADFPDSCPWNVKELLNHSWLPAGPESLTALKE